MKKANAVELHTTEDKKSNILSVRTNSYMAKHKVLRCIDFVDSFLKYKVSEDAVKKFGLQKADSVVTA